MIHVETTTIGKYTSFEEAKQVISWLSDQGYPTDDIYIHKVNAKHHGSHVDFADFSADVLAVIGAILGLDLLLLSSNPSPLVILGLVLLTAFVGVYIYRKMSRIKARNSEDTDTCYDCYFIQANSIEDARMIKALLSTAA